MVWLAATDGRQDRHFITVREHGGWTICRIFTIDPHTGRFQDGSERHAVPTVRSVEQSVERRCFFEKELVSAAPGGFTRRGKQPQAHCHCTRLVSMFVRAVGKASRRCGSIGSP